MEENMRPTTATHEIAFDFQALLHPGTVIEHPWTWSRIRT
jgi:hypothetical protein